MACFVICRSSFFNKSVPSSLQGTVAAFLFNTGQGINMTPLFFLTRVERFKNQSPTGFVLLKFLIPTLSWVIQNMLACETSSSSERIKCTC